LMARPASDVLSALGRLSPKPIAFSRAGATPRSIRAWRTALARAADSL